MTQGRAWKMGVKAFADGKSESDNPFLRCNADHEFSWRMGFIDARLRAAQ